MEKLTDYIMTINDSIPIKTVQLILNEYKESESWLPYTKGKSGGDTPSNAIMLSHPKIIQNSVTRKTISEEATKSILNVFDKYHEKFSRRQLGMNFLDVKQLVGLRLIRYQQGESMDNHVDKYPDPDTKAELWPAVTFTINLNDDYSGGQLDILDGNLICETKARQCIMFPSNFLYPHQVHTVKEGTRFSLVGWFV